MLLLKYILISTEVFLRQLFCGSPFGTRQTLVFLRGTKCQRLRWPEECYVPWRHLEVKDSLASYLRLYRYNHVVGEDMTRGMPKLQYYIITSKAHPAYLYDVYIYIYTCVYGERPLQTNAWCLHGMCMHTHAHVHGDAHASTHTPRCVRTVQMHTQIFHTRANTDRTTIRWQTSGHILSCILAAYQQLPACTHTHTRTPWDLHTNACNHSIYYFDQLCSWQIAVRSS